MRITARRVAYQVLEDAESTVVAVEGSAGELVELQRALVFDPTDPESGLHCVVLDAGPCSYGAVQHVDFDSARGILRLDLISGAVEELGLPAGDDAIEIDISRAAYPDRLLDHIQNILAGPPRDAIE